MKRLHILNGPNLNLLGIREPEIYGSENFEHVLSEIQHRHPDVEVIYFQSNHEGGMVDFIHNLLQEKSNGLIINAGAYSHYSYALQDALKLLSIPKIEVHISNVFQREPFRHISVLSCVCNGVITGLGRASYTLAADWILQQPHFS